MRSVGRFLKPYCFRAVLTSTFFMAAMTLFTPVEAKAFMPNSDSAEAAAHGAGSVSNYRWNLSNVGLPLISLPDQINEGIDLSLTYSMDQFEFPLFQSLYYNARAHKYILMVIPAGGRGIASSLRESQKRPAEFVNLDPVRGEQQFEAHGKLHVRLLDQGGVMLLSTSGGTIYTFVRFADGELHCSQIKDSGGVVMNLEYTNESSIQKIADGRGRSISFSYTNHYVSSITQTWGANSARLKKTWVIADEVSYAHRPSVYARSARTGTAKHIPSNAIRPDYTHSMMASDLELAAIFGGPGAVAAANGFEPASLGSQYPRYRGDLIADDGRTLRGHLSFAMHLYGSGDGRSETEVFVPVGFTSHTNEPSPTDAVVTFYYPRLGNFTDVTLAVFHVTDFQVIPELGRVRIGRIGGPGGSIASYKHSHLEFYHGNTGLPPLANRVQLRIDPATVFTTTAIKR